MEVEDKDLNNDNNYVKTEDNELIERKQFIINMILDPVEAYITKKELYLNSYVDTNNSTNLLDKGCNEINCKIINYNFANTEHPLENTVSSNFTPLNDSNKNITEINTNDISIENINKPSSFIENVMDILTHCCLKEEYESFNYFGNNFLKGCKWSPDGSYLLACSNDNNLRNFKFADTNSQMELISKVQEGDIIYDFEWCPLISDKIPFYASTSRDQPIHLRNALNGSLISSYRSFNQMDELAPCTSLTFSRDGLRIYCGLEKMIKVFEVSRPGREYESRPTFVKMGQHGLISCISFNPVLQTMYAAGSYSKSVALYSEPMGNIICMLLGQTGGVTHIRFSEDGNRLYSGGRKDNEILCWDIRHLGQILYIMKRDVETNQRFYFNFDSSDRFLISGDQNGFIKIWDTKNPTFIPNSEPILQPLYSFKGHNDAVTSISFNPINDLLASGCGQRHFRPPQFSENIDYEELESDEDSDDENEDDLSTEENSLKIWRLNLV